LKKYFLDNPNNQTQKKQKPIETTRVLKEKIKKLVFLEFNTRF